MLKKMIFAAIVSIASLGAHADWPERPVKFIVPYPPGGPSDLSLRTVGKRLSEIWNQPVLIENKPGAPGMISAIASKPDGYTLVLGANSNIVTEPLVNKRLAYKPLTDLVPISLLLTNKPVLVAHSSTGIKSLKELIAYAKSHPGEINYSSPGLGSPSHLMTEMLDNSLQIKMTHIPYRGGTASLSGLISGDVQIGIFALPTVLPYIKNGKLIPLSMVSNSRDAQVPNVSTLSEAGIKDVDFEVWYGIFAPKNTDSNIVSKVSSDMQKVLKEEGIVQSLRSHGSYPQGASPADFAKKLNNEVAAWTKLIKSNNIKIDD